MWVLLQLINISKICVLFLIILVTETLLKPVLLRLVKILPNLWWWYNSLKERSWPKLLLNYSLLIIKFVLNNCRSVNFTTRWGHLPISVHFSPSYVIACNLPVFDNVQVYNSQRSKEITLPCAVWNLLLWLRFDVGKNNRKKSKMSKAIENDTSVVSSNNKFLQIKRSYFWVV